jgi:hypothetical protein
MTRIASLRLRSSLTLALLTLVPSFAAAQAVQAVDDEDPAAADRRESAAGLGGTELSDEQALLEEQAPREQGRSGFEPGERENQDYFFLGALARAQILPSFPFELGGVTFPAGYDVPVNGAVGAFFNYRRNNFNIQLEVFYQGMGWSGFLRGTGDPQTETEFIESQLGIVFGSFNFSWAFPITEWFAIEVGMGLGFGGVVGDLYRTEAYQATGTGEWQPCSGPGVPDSAYCEGPLEMPNPSTGRLDGTRTRGGTYQQITGPNPHYFGEGGVPPMFATIDLPRLSFRFKPIHQIQIRVDTAFNLYGVSLGGSVAYGF